ncbi:hypothetical protein Daus18300_010043 [Diaporthe australafricana]|uniref:FAD-binding PCMH-type domain-containing protein n=1 Tax=Diaporthe australafricana TaxID=127596 RepID=A0ABR3WC27_9PEZI
MVPKTALTNGSRERTRFRTGAGVVKRARIAKSGRRVNRPPPPQRPREPDLISLFESQDIPVFTPGDLEYERAVACSNLLYRFSRPTYVVQPKENLHVQTIVMEAKSRRLAIKIKNGGHSYSGSSFPHEGIMLDLKNIHEVDFDKDEMMMTIQGGALWGNVYRALVDDEEGLMINGGRCPSVGVSGFILGGGIGPFSRSLGMAVDNLMEVTIVTADGELTTVSAEDAPDTPEGMLFWALCGAGGGNFGVVVQLKIRVEKLVTPGPEATVVAGRYTWFPEVDQTRRTFFGFPRSSDDGTGLLATMNHFYTTDWPEQMTIDSSWLSDLEQQNGALGVRFLAYYDGKDEDFGKLWDEETKRSTPANSTFRIFSSFCFTNDQKKIEKITAIVKEELEAFKALFGGESSGLCQVSFIHSGGQASKRERSATAFRWRECIYHAYIMIQWKDKWLERDMRGFCKRFKARLRPYSMAGKASFVNFPDATMPSTDYMKAYYGNNRDKLQEVKRIWDETNLFKWDQGVRPTQVDEKEEPEDRRAKFQAAMDSTGQQEVELSDGESANEDGQTDFLSSNTWESRISVPLMPQLTMAEAYLNYGMEADFTEMLGILNP